MSRSVDDRQRTLSAGAAMRVAALGLLLASCGSGDGGDPATWSIGNSQLTRETDRFEALVTRLGCAGGVTGKVFEPSISIGDDTITIRFEVEPIGDGPQTCPGNDEVPVVVELGEPIGERSLVDGACLAGREASSTSACADKGVRWSPPPPPFECDTPTSPARDLDMELVPVPPVAGGQDGRDQFGAEVIDVLEPMVLGADAGTVVATLRGTRWTVTVVEQPVTTTTVTPDLLWNRLVVAVCDGRIDTIAFD